MSGRGCSAVSVRYGLAKCPVGDARLFLSGRGWPNVLQQSRMLGRVGVSEMSGRGERNVGSGLARCRTGVGWPDFR